MPASDRQIQMRMPVLEFLSHGNSAERSIGDGVVIGFALVLEVMSPKGERDIAKVTSDASGNPLPWYTVEGFARALDDLEEFDDYEEDE